MHWTLSRVAGTCSWRRLRAALRANPLVAALVFTALPGLPLLAFAAGRAAAPVLEAAAADAALARALALPFVVAALAAGVAIALLAPTRALLGPQLEPAPVRAASAFVGLTLLPACFVAAPLAVLVAAFGFPATAASGTWAGAALVAALAATAALGAAAAEAGLGTVRRSRRAAGTALAVAVVWVACGRVGGATILGPAAALGRGLYEPQPLVAASLCLVLLAGLGLWTAAAVARPPARGRRSFVRFSFPVRRRPSLAVATSAFVRLMRNAPTRRHVAGGVAFAVVGVVAMRWVLGDGAAAAPYVGAIVALLTGASLPLIAAGLRRDGAWLLRVAPVSPHRLAAAHAAAAVLGAYAVIALTVAIVAPLGRLDGGALVMLESTAALVFGVAAATGAVLPWHEERVLEQLGSYALLAVAAASLTFALGRTLGAAAVAGMTESLFIALVAHAVLLAGIGVAAVLDE